MGVADGLRAAGLLPERWPMIGTSAGAHCAAALDLGLSFEAVAELWERYIDGQSRWQVAKAIELSEPIYRTRGELDVGAVAVRLLTFRRRVLSADDHPLADIVAASSSVFPLVSPHKIDGKRYIDGGAISLASIDLSPPADLLLAITPFGVKGQGIGGVAGRWQARRETRVWSKRHRGDVLVVTPSHAMAAIGGAKIRDLGDMRIGRAVYPAAVELGHHVADIVARDRPELVGDGSTSRRAGRPGLGPPTK